MEEFHIHTQCSTGENKLKNPSSSSVSRASKTPPFFAFVLQINVSCYAQMFWDEFSSSESKLRHKHYSPSGVNGVLVMFLQPPECLKQPTKTTCEGEVYKEKHITQL